MSTGQHSKKRGEGKGGPERKGSRAREKRRERRVGGRKQRDQAKNERCEESTGGERKGRSQEHRTRQDNHRTGQEGQDREERRAKGGKVRREVRDVSSATCKGHRMTIHAKYVLLHIIELYV